MHPSGSFPFQQIYWGYDNQFCKKKPWSEAKKKKEKKKQEINSASTHIHIPAYS